MGKRAPLAKEGAGLPVAFGQNWARAGSQESVGLSMLWQVPQTARFGHGVSALAKEVGAPGGLRVGAGGDGERPTAVVFRIQDQHGRADMIGREGR